MQGARVWYLIGELWSHMLRSATKNLKKKKKSNFWLTWIIDWFMQNGDSFHLDIWKEEDKTANFKPWTKQLDNFL